MMHEISTAGIRVSDVGNRVVGNRVVVIDDAGTAYSGIVTNATANVWEIRLHGLIGYIVRGDNQSEEKS